MTHPTTPTTQEATMTTTPTLEQDCRAFAALYPTPNVLAGIAYAEAGRITWGQLHGLCTKSLGDAIAAVGR